MIEWDYPPRCQSPHVASPRSHCERLTWNAPREREKGRVRVVRWTCDCEAIFFELCQAGGLRFIRRTKRTAGNPLVEESDRWPATEADAVWAALLFGLVR
ncbi:hypothetical protein [Streptosporangium carneum]|uniref:Uncharacterized protein n=1 Tax=Streptosporangium carneum TaxID=47481 RepID=A0A9W6I6Y5_9ACTN|nr:hypothetical protein [Streptosporangium carneum]GLK13262.1 hypothetical protein GCM10017600_66730 [Streptosporangium carneum]